MASWHPDNMDEHESGQLRLTVAGEQVSLLPLPDETIPTSDEPQAVDELEPEKRYGVFVHSSGADGGYVVRTLHDGTPAAPYRLNDCLAIYQREHAAQKHANKLNAAQRFAAHGYGS